MGEDLSWEGRVVMRWELSLGKPFAFLEMSSVRREEVDWREGSAFSALAENLSLVYRTHGR